MPYTLEKAKDSWICICKYHKSHLQFLFFHINSSFATLLKIDFSFLYMKSNRCPTPPYIFIFLLEFPVTGILEHRDLKSDEFFSRCPSLPLLTTRCLSYFQHRFH